MSRWIDVDAQNWKSTEICPVKNNLTEHPLLQLDELYKLALRLPQAQVRHHNGHIPINTSLETVAHQHATGRTLEDTIRNIESAGSFVFLQNIQTDEVFGKLVNECLDQLQPMVEAQEPGMYFRQGWIFISSPGITTPYHRDQETNFLLQIRGTKTVSVFPQDDKEVVSEEESEIFHGLHSLRATFHSEEKQKRAKVFEFKPGDGAYIPYTAPHWVKNGPGVSVSLSVTYHTSKTLRRKNVYRLNHGLRKRGLKPSPFGKSPWLDTLKHKGYQAFLGTKSAIGFKV